MALLTPPASARHAAPAQPWVADRLSWLALLVFPAAILADGLSTWWAVRFHQARERSPGAAWLMESLPVGAVMLLGGLLCLALAAMVLVQALPRSVRLGFFLLAPLKLLAAVHNVLLVVR